MFSSVFHSLLVGFRVLFRSRFLGWFGLMAMKKAPVRGLFTLVNRDSETHHTGNSAQIGIEVGMEGSVVVADGAVGILEAVAGQHADHR